LIYAHFFRNATTAAPPKLLFKGKGGRKRGFKNRSYITDMLNKEPEQHVGDIFKNRFIEAKDNLEQKI
jgi:hypothetical protein